jgi:hypothetical protein
MEVGSYQPLAKGKDVHREEEAEGSRRKSPEPRYTNDIRHIQSGRVSQTERSLVTMPEEMELIPRMRITAGVFSSPKVAIIPTPEFTTHASKFNLNVICILLKFTQNVH